MKFYYEKMSLYILKEVLCNQYNRKDEKRFDRSVVFVIQNTKNGNLALFQLDRISKNRASLRCNNRSCGHRLSLEHNIATEAFGSQRGRKIASSVEWPVVGCPAWCHILGEKNVSTRSHVL